MRSRSAMYPGVQNIGAAIAIAVVQTMRTERITPNSGAPSFVVPDSIAS